MALASPPMPPLNAAIALSILFLGPEIVRHRRGQTSVTIRHPWVVAFGFGLLHGFGFATGLTAMGLPSSEIPLALLLFNLGVELGQLAFVVLALLLVRAFRVLQIRWPQWVDQSRPLPFGVHLGEQFVLPGEGRVAVNRLVVVDKVGGRQTEVRAAFVTAMSDVAAYVPGCLVSRRAHWVPPTGAQSP